jgi:hypothetical protein
MGHLVGVAVPQANLEHQPFRLKSQKITKLGKLKEIKPTLETLF